MPRKSTKAWNAPFDYQALHRLAGHLLNYSHPDAAEAARALNLILIAHRNGVDVVNVLLNAITPDTLMNAFVASGKSLNAAAKLAAEITGKDADTLRRRIRRDKLQLEPIHKLKTEQKKKS